MRGLCEGFARAVRGVGDCLLGEDAEVVNAQRVHEVLEPRVGANLKGGAGEVLTHGRECASGVTGGVTGGVTVDVTVDVTGGVAGGGASRLPWSRCTASTAFMTSKNISLRTKPRCEAARAKVACSTACHAALRRWPCVLRAPTAPPVRGRGPMCSRRARLTSFLWARPMPPPTTMLKPARVSPSASMMTCRAVREPLESRGHRLAA